MKASQKPPLSLWLDSSVCGKASLDAHAIASVQATGKE